VNSTYKKASRVDLLQRLDESYVILFERCRPRRTFDIILAISAPRGSGRSDFVQLRFYGVRIFFRERARIASHRRFKEAFHNEVGVLLIFASQGEPNAPPNWIQFWFGVNFGGLSFKYDRRRAWERSGKAIKRGDVYNCIDTETGEEFEFNNPFPRLRTRPGRR